MGQLTHANFILRLLPEVNTKQIGMVLQKYLYGISPVKHSTDSFIFIGFLQEDIQRRYPAFDIGMVDDDAILCNPYCMACQSRSIKRD